MMRMSRPLATLAVAALIPVLAGCGSAPTEKDEVSSGGDYPVTIDTCGFTSELKARPKRAVTVSQGATEVALALGVSDQVAGTAYLDDEIPKKWKADYDAIPKVWKKYPDYESLISERPDFVYASYISAYDKDAAGDRKELEKGGIASMTSPFGCGKGGEKPKDGITFESVWDEIDLAAEAFGVPDRAEAIRTDQKKQLADLKSQGAGDGLDVFWYDSGDTTPFAGTGEGGPQLILDAIGATNVFADVAKGWADVSWEKVIEADPDVIVLADASWSSAQEKIEHLRKDPVLRQLRAVKTESFATLPFSETTPGVRLVEGATDLGRQFEKLQD